MSAALLAAIGVWLAAPAQELIVADRELAGAALAKMLGPHGQVLGVDPDGFTRLRPKPRHSGDLAAQLRSAGVDYVFDSSVRRPNFSQIESTRAYVDYVRARKSLSPKESEAFELGHLETFAQTLALRAGPDGVFDREAFLQADRQRRHLPAAPLSRFRTSGRPAGAWTFVGPKNQATSSIAGMGDGVVSGRKNDVAYAPSNPNVIYLASARGGVWKTTDGGTTWAIRSSLWTHQQTTSVAVDPTDPNTVYVGTGDDQAGPLTLGQGIMKTTDGGATWINQGADVFGEVPVTKIQIDPTNRLRVVALTGRAPEFFQGHVYFSEDGGTNWIEEEGLPAGNWEDIEIGIPNGSGERIWWLAGTTSGGAKLYRSYDGHSWVEVGSPTPGIELAIEIAASRVDPEKIYFLSTAHQVVLASVDAGETWSNITGDLPGGSNWSQSLYDYQLTAARNGTKDALYCGLITLSVSPTTNGKWTDIGARTHHDQHAQEIHPTNDNESIVVNDGGAYRCVLNPAAGTATYTSLNATIYDSLFYAMALHPTDPTRVMGGTQDLATPASRGDLANWRTLLAGDSGWAAFDRHSGVHYSTSPGAIVWQYPLADSPVADAVLLRPTMTTASMAPTIVAGDGSQLIVGGDRLARWTGLVWDYGSQELGLISTLAVAPSDSRVIYTGAFDGQVWYTTDVGATYHRIDASPLPDIGVGDITVMRGNPFDVLVGFGTGELYRCRETRASAPIWERVNGTGATALPLASIDALETDLFDPTVCYAGGDLGLFMTTNEGATWSDLNALGLPYVWVTDLEVSTADNNLYVATYGRGIWRMPLAETIPLPQSVVIHPSSVIGGSPTKAAVNVAPAPLVPKTISLRDDSAFVSVPATVTVLPGQTRAPFRVTTTPVTTARTATIFASNGGVERSATVVLFPAPSFLNFTLDPAVVRGGSPSTGRVSFVSVLPAAGLLYLSSDQPTVARPPAEVPLLMGTISRTFTVTTFAVSEEKLVTLTAQVGSRLRTATLRVTP